MSSSAPSSTLAELYDGESARVRYTFETTGDGLAAARERSRLMDKVVAQLYRDLLSPDPAGPGNFCLLAVGGYGRQELFPYSDVDLLFLSESARISEPFRQPVAALARALWDLRLRVGHSARTLAECRRLPGLSRESLAGPNPGTRSVRAPGEPRESMAPPAAGARGPGV